MFHKHYKVALLLALSAAAPAGTDPDSARAHWFQSLKDTNGISCCSLADGREVQARIRGDHWQAFIDRKSFGPEAPEAWVDVPPEAVLRVPSLEGFPVAFFYNGAIHCFVAPSGA